MIFDPAYALSILPLLLRASVVTIEASIGGMVVAIVAGLALAILRRSGRRPVRRIATLYLQFIRSTPLLIQIFFLFYVLPLYGVRVPTVLCGVVALGLHYATYTAEVFRSGIEAVPLGQWEAARALSLPPRQIWRHVVLPQAIPPVIPALGNYLVAMIKDTPLLATIGIQELLGSALFEASRTYRYYEPLILVGLLFLVFSLAASFLGSRLEARHARQP